MLQQTTVNAVIPYYERWIKEFPTVHAVAKAPLQKILKIWQGLGYYSRAKNIHKSSKVICKDYNGEIPKSPEQLKKLPGFGPYTIGAVLSIAFDERQPIIDANVRRVVMRQLALRGHADISQDKAVLEFLNNVMPPKGNNIFNQALMELGALVCRNKEALCNVCPVKFGCQAYKKGRQEIIPLPKKKIIKDIEAAVAIIKKDSKFFIQKRPSNGLLADLWEFPGGKIESGESAKAALYREIKEELGVETIHAEHLLDVTHFYTQFRVRLSAWFCQPKTYPRSDATHRWVSLAQLNTYPFPSGSAKIIERLRSK